MAVFYEGRVGFVDEHGLRGSKTLVLEVDDAEHTTASAQFTAAVAAMNDFVEAFDNVIDPKIDTLGLKLNLPMGGLSLKSEPGEQGTAEGANLTLSTLKPAGGPVYERPYWLPGAKEGVFLSDFKTVDTGDTELLSWVASFTATTGVVITISDDERVQSIVRGRYATKQRDSGE